MNFGLQKVVYTLYVLLRLFCLITTLLRGMNRVVPGHLEDSDCQSLKPGSWILSGTPGSAVRRHCLHFTQGTAQPPHSPGLVPPGQSGRVPWRQDFPSGVLCGLITESQSWEPRIQKLRLTFTHLFLLNSDLAPLRFLEILLTQLIPGWFVGAKTCEKLALSPVFFSLPPKGVAGKFCQSRIAYLSHIRWGHFLYNVQGST